MELSLARGPNRFEAGVDSANSSGVLLTDPGAANTEGTWTQIIASTAQPACGFWVVAVASAVTSGAQWLIDIGAGANPNEQALINDLHVSCGQNPQAQPVFVPLFIPAGTRLSGRYRTSSTSLDPRVGLILVPVHPHGGGSFGRCYTYGAVTAGATGGTQVDSTNGANTEGNWVEIEASTDAHHRAFFASWGMRSNATTQLARYLLDIGAGASTAEQPILSNFIGTTTVGGDTLLPGFTPLLPCSIPQGTRLAARVQTSETDATDRKPDVIIYCFS